MGDGADGSAGLTRRDRHLFGPGPKRILSLDGGGVRGALTVAFLMRLEELLDKETGTRVRLGDYFDLIGGGPSGGGVGPGPGAGGLGRGSQRFFPQPGAA